MFELIALLANESSKLSKKDAFTAISGLVDKMSDIKLKGLAGDALTAMSEALGPQFVFTQLHKKAAAHKNPKVSSATSAFISADYFWFDPIFASHFLVCCAGYVLKLT